MLQNNRDRVRMLRAKGIVNLDTFKVGLERNVEMRFAGKPAQFRDLKRGANDQAKRSSTSNS